MNDSRNDDTPEEPQGDNTVAERQKDFTRRALLRAGWVAPLVTVVNIPSAFAQSPGPPHADHADHTDLPHTDTPPPHTDTPPPHTDVPHTDVPHTDVPHTDHADAPHQDHQDHADSHVDSHVDTHSDVPAHVDVPHLDANLRQR